MFIHLYTGAVLPVVAIGSTRTNTDGMHADNKGHLFYMVRL